MECDLKMSFLSIIVPVYKVEAYLNRCIDSILNQRYRNFELILVNDGSPDKSGNICDEYQLKDKRVRVIHKTNGGLSSARNEGLKVAIGEYVGFVDSDDWITSDMYSFLIENALKYDADIVASSYKLTKGDSSIKKEKCSIFCLSGQAKMKYYLEHGMKYRVADYSVCNKVYRTKLFEKIKFPEGQLYEDVVTNYKLIKIANKYVKSNKITYFYFQDCNSITRNGFKQQDYDVLLVGKQLVELATEENNYELLELAKMKEARAYFSMLSKISVYGFSADIKNKEEIIRELRFNLIGNYLLLIKSPMPLNRKIIMTLLCVNEKIISRPISIYHKFKIIFKSRLQN